jgi:hypothetical protein
MIMIIIIQLDSYLFACQLNSPKANYKVSMSERNIRSTKNEAIHNI